MTESNRYPLRWRGQTTGPFTREEILAQLDDQKIGLYHEVQFGGQWLTVEEFLPQADKQRRQDDLRARDSQAKRQTMMELGASGSRTTALPSVAPFKTQPVRGAPPAGLGAPVFTSRPPVNAQPLYRPRRLPIFVGLGLGLGFLGAHNWYAGYRVTAIIQMIVTALTLFFGLGFFITWVWAFAELIIVHSDQRGVRMV